MSKADVAVFARALSRRLLCELGDEIEILVRCVMRDLDETGARRAADTPTISRLRRFDPSSSGDPTLWALLVDIVASVSDQMRAADLEWPPPGRCAPPRGC